MVTTTIVTWWAGSGSNRGGRLVRSVADVWLPPAEVLELVLLPGADVLLPLLLWELLRACLELGDAHSTPIAGGNSRGCCGFLEVQI